MPASASRSGSRRRQRSGAARAARRAAAPRRRGSSGGDWRTTRTLAPVTVSVLWFLYVIFPPGTVARNMHTHQSRRLPLFWPRPSKYRDTVDCSTSGSYRCCVGASVKRPGHLGVFGANVGFPGPGVYPCSRGGRQSIGIQSIVPVAVPTALVSADQSGFQGNVRASGARFGFPGAVLKHSLTSCAEAIGVPGNTRCFNRCGVAGLQCVNKKVDGRISGVCPWSVSFVVCRGP